MSTTAPESRFATTGRVAIGTPAAPTTGEGTTPALRCGRCQAELVGVAGRRETRCARCGWMNAIPRDFEVRCLRCKAVQSVRFSECAKHPPCIECGQNLTIESVPLLAIAPRLRRVHVAHRPQRHDRAVASLMFVAAVIAAILTGIIIL